MSGVPVIIVFRINKAGMEKMKKNNKGKLNNKKQVLIIIAVISIMVFICIVLQAYIEGYFGGKKKSVKTQTQNTINREKDGSKADSNDNKSSKTKNTKTVKKNNTAKNKRKKHKKRRVEHIAAHPESSKPLRVLITNSNFSGENYYRKLGKIDYINLSSKTFEILEKEGLVEYDKYDKSKNWKTIIDMLGQNYPFGLSTERGKNIEEFDLMYDEFIENNFPEQLEFSKQFREFAKEVMATNYKLENPNMTAEEEINYKLKIIKNTADGFLLVQKDESGKIEWIVNMKKINTFMNPADTIQEAKGRSL